MNVRFIFPITENTFFLKGFKSRLEDVFFTGVRCEKSNLIFFDQTQYLSGFVLYRAQLTSNGLEAELNLGQNRC